MTAPALVLLAHGHSDPSIAEITHAMRHELVERLPGMIVRAAYLGSPSPDPLSVVGKMARTGVEEVVVVPLEIGCAWNPSEEARDAVERASAGLPDVRIQLSRPIGPEPTLLPLLDQALRQGLAEHHVTELDGLVLSTAGTSDVRSRAVLARRARQWGLHHKLSCVTAYADDSGPSVEEAIQTLWHQGRRHVAVGSWFLSASATWARQAEQALGHGATAVSRPIASAPDIATLVMQRYVVGAMDLVDFGDLLGDEADEPQLHAIGA